MNITRKNGIYCNLGFDFQYLIYKIIIILAIKKAIKQFFP